MTAYYRKVTPAGKYDIHEFHKFYCEMFECYSIFKKMVTMTNISIELESESLAEGEGEDDSV